jgi:hypothetical protein
MAGGNIRRVAAIGAGTIGASWSIDLRELPVQHTLGSLTEMRRRIEVKDGKIPQHCLRGVFVPTQHLDSIGMR